MTTTLPDRHCKTCGQPIIFATTETGALMPIDANPHPNGRLKLERDRNWHHVTILKEGTLELAAAHRDRTPLHQPHWVTCTHPDQHRRR